ncbi:hypothetical protein EMIHUDRAFT_216987 [Emiliania huxleyi CCMP1516]|uniref:ABC transporter domain-containing protein n=2 Tax=Emiliania huxleyi TaxID=2903 RepID=A0A0D3ICY2_EMIH1|nr:hypothetical protein EMIHUDRAFT_216987 [Emiliania huxleyi CCMP1516]EOD09117.1 hypothetical protein EMIHUDRAFT_216987 [Emiliania huxleyi CCMP1516]|eukprot:XP_005761546.1 hypothetical protein EMIHUDRAFT_216987 [Emiliania huxleyi CCMP1516]
MAAFSLSDVRFAYATTSPAVLSNVTLEVAPRSRVVLVGANGAGKSTLLRLVAGRRRASGGSARTLGGDAFECTTNALRVNLVTADWESDLTLPVSRLVAGAVRASGASVPRVSRLIEALGVEELLEKELHSLSDGQQRRVQLFCKLLPERDLATNSLDVLSRAALLSFLREESEGRGATVVFATHIFDGLDGWATDLVHLDGGMLLRHLPAASLARASLHATERRRAGDAAGRRTTDDLARSLVAAATAAVSEAHAAAEWSAALKRSRPAPAEDAAASTKAASAMQPKAPPMPAAAQRIAPVLQGALGALSAAGTTDV